MSAPIDLPFPGTGLEASPPGPNTITELAATPFANQLPAELLVPIFLQAIDFKDESEEVWKSIQSIALVCRLWRDVLFGEPALWRDARFFPKEGSSASVDLQLHLLSLCDLRSRSTIAQAKLMGHFGKRSHDGQTAILRRSLPSLSNLEINYDLPSGIARHKWEHRVRFAAPAQQDREEVLLDLMQLMSQAHNLKRLALNIDLYYAAFGCFGVSPPESPILPFNFPARPTEVILRRDLSAARDLNAKLTPFMREICARVEHLSYTKLHFEPVYWLQWAWNMVLSRAQEMRSFHLSLSEDIEGELCSRPAICFPVLREARITADRSIDNAGMPWIQRLRLEMPALRRLHTFALVADRLSAPTVRQASIDIHCREDVPALVRAMELWPYLECLTLRVESNVDIQAVIDALIPSRGGSVRLPSLRRLGIDLMLGDSKIHFHGLECDPDWAAKSWCDDEKLGWSEFWRRCGVKRLACAVSDLQELESQRRQLASASEVSCMPAIIESDGPLASHGPGKL